MKEHQETLRRLAVHNVKLTGVCKTIDEHAKDAIEQAPKDAKNYKPLDVLVSTALAINSRWASYARPRVERFQQFYSHDFDDIAAFHNEFNQLSANQFLHTYFDTNGGEKNQKYTRMQALLNGFELCAKSYPIKSDKEILENWANHVDVDQHTKDVFGSQKNIGPATLKNILLCMGKNVTKPDRQVIKVLNQEFGVNPCKASEFEAFAEQLGVKPLYLDQVLFHYGRINQLKCD